MKLSRSTLADVALVAVTAVWGSTFVVVKDAVERMPVMDFLAWRFAIAAIVMAAVRPRCGRRARRRGRRLRRRCSASRSAAGTSLRPSACSTRPRRCPASSPGCSSSSPRCAPAVLLRKRIDAHDLARGRLATAGSPASRCTASRSAAARRSRCCARWRSRLHIVGLGEWSSSYDAAGLAVVQLATVAVLSIVIAAPQSLAPPPDAGAWGAVLLTAIAATALAFFVQTWAQAHLRADPRGGRHDDGAGVRRHVRRRGRRRLARAPRIVVGARARPGGDVRGRARPAARKGCDSSSDSSSIDLRDALVFGYFTGSGLMLGRVE